MSRLSRRVPLAVALTAAAGAAIVPSAANAAVTPTFDPGTNTLTITGDDQDDAVTIATAGGVYTVNGAATTAPVSDTTAIVVNAGAGRDNVSAVALAAATDYGTLTVDAGDGDDLVTGGAKADTLAGGTGDDRVVGFRGNDTMAGGAGNDVLVWNNGDGSDVMNGDAGGGDEVEVNGAATAGDDFTIVPNGPRVKFDRINLVPFTLDTDTERFTINGLGGDDKVTGAPGLAPLTLMAINGGDGVDTITGGDGPDLINGDDANDVLDGAGGADRVIGDRGNDAMRGGDGDDVLVWNNGDGSDSNDGDAGIDVSEFNGAAAAGDALTLVPNGARLKFDRTNLVPVTIDSAVEAFSVNGLDGDDTLAVSPGVGALAAVTANGGPGNDTITGAEETDTFFGGSGNDTLTGGAGSDTLAGDDGNDRMLARDTVGDLVDGGTGTDSAQTDAATVDVVTGVESVDATPPAPAPDTNAVAARVRVANAQLERTRTGRLVARIPVECPAAETGGCRATLSLATATSVKLGKVRLVAALGSKAITLQPGQRATVRVTLPKGANGLVKNRRLTVKASIVSRDAAGNLATSSRTVKLTIPKKAAR